MNRLITLILLVAAIQVVAQPKNKIYKLRVFITDGKVKSGYLRELNDSVIVISPQPVLRSKTESIPLKSIKSVRARDRHALWRGTLLGAAGGALLGALIGVATYEPTDCTGAFICLDFGPGYNAAGGAVIGALSGAVIGLAAGSSSKEIKLNEGQDSSKLISGELGQYIIQPK